MAELFTEHLAFKISKGMRDGLLKDMEEIKRSLPHGIKITISDVARTAIEIYLKRTK